MAAPYCCKCAESASQSAKKHLADLPASCPPIFQFYTARLPCHVMICCPLCQCGCVCRLTRGGGRSTSSSGLSSLSLCMAARFGATIVPFGGVGLDDGFDMLLEPKQIRAIPVLGKLLEDNAKKRIPPARRCAAHPPTCMTCSKPSLSLGASCFIPIGIRDAA